MSFRGRHDIYDDTRYGHDARREEQRARSSRRSRYRRDERRDEGRNDWLAAPFGHGMMPEDPFAGFGMMESPHGNGFGGGSLFGAMRGMMSSMDRMFEDMTSSSRMMSGQNGGSGGGTYYYESKTRTVGPDGRVREEVVRTTPGSDGRPQTQRSVREGDDAREMGPFSVGFENDPNQPRIDNGEPDVVVEELDEYGNVINSNVEPRRSIAPRESNSADAQTQGSGWWNNRYNQPRRNQA